MQTARRPAAVATVAIALITALAAVLRLNHLGSVPGDPFYDAAVRSMGLSWHNFFFGAFEPDGSVSIDKPPLDLWLQVLSVKLLGFSSFTLKLPEALAGTLSVPVLYAAVRRPFGRGAGLAAALALAVMPIEVITSRSDTMDGLMMLLIVVALWCCVRAAGADSTRWLLLAAVALGLAFNVKLLESVVPIPGLALLAYLGLPGSRRRRALQLLAAGVVYVAVALSWLTATLLFPAHDRPFAIGSTNGSAWNAAFVFNGSDRIGGTNAEGTTTITYGSTSGFPTATQAERDHIPITAPSPTRLLATVGPLSGERLGLEVLAALLLGGPALLATWAAPLAPALRRRRHGLDRRSDPVEPRFDDPAANAAATTAASREREPRAIAPDAPLGASGGDAGATPTRLQRATAAGLLTWLAVGIVLFSEQARLHPRYVEAFTPAVAAVLGIGVAWAVGGRRPARLAWLAIVLAVLTAYAERLVYGTIGAWWVMAVASVLAVLTAALALLAPAGRRAALRVAAAALILVAVLSIPLKASLDGIRANVSDAGHVGALQPTELRLVSAYLRAHQGSAHYEVAAASATAVGALIVKDVRPVLVLTTLQRADAYPGRPAAGADRRAGRSATRCSTRRAGPTPPPPTRPARPPPAGSVRMASTCPFRPGLGRRAVLWRLPEPLAWARWTPQSR